MGTTITIHVTKPMLLRDIQESRSYYAGLGWNVRDCSIMSNPFADHIRLASDTGAIDYTFADDGQVRREHHDCPHKLIEFIDIDIAQRIVQHNQSIRDRQLICGAA